MQPNPSGRVFLSVFCRSYLKALFLPLFGSHCTVHFISLNVALKCLHGRLYKHPTGRASLHQLWKMVQALRSTYTSTLIIWSLFEQERTPGGIKEKVIFLYTEREGLPGSYKHETPDLPGVPDFGFPRGILKAEVDPSSPGAQTTLSGWLPS